MDNETAPANVGSMELLGVGAEENYLASDMRNPDVRPRFTVQAGGRWIDDDDFIFDSMLKITGVFTDEARLQFAKWIADTLNEADKTLPRRKTPNVELSGGPGTPGTSDPAPG